LSTANSEPPISDRLKAQLPMAKAWIHEAVLKTDERLLELLDERRTALENSLRGISEIQAHYVPGEDQWSIDDVARHLAHANNRVAGLIEALASGYVPGGSPEMGFVPRDDRSFAQVMGDLMASFDMLRDELKAISDPEANLEVKYRHPFFDELNAREWFVFNFVHASAHIQQIERIKSNPGFPET
jgi:hypothetical protein